MTLTTRDHPEADGKHANYGDQQWVVTLPLEDDDLLTLRLGRKGRDLLFGMLIADCSDNNEQEPTPCPT